MSSGMDYPLKLSGDLNEELACLEGGHMIGKFNDSGRGEL